MKILIATDAFPPLICGVTTTLMALKNELESRDIEVRFIEPNQYFNFPTPGYKEIPTSFPTNIKEIIQEYQPDYIHIHTEGIIGLVTSRICKKLDIPFTTTYATNFADMIQKIYKIPACMVWWYLRKIHNSATRTLVATDALVNELHENGVKRVVTFGKGVDAGLFNSSYRNDELFQEYENPIWLYVGRISVEKNLEAFLDLDLPGTKVLVGRGPALEKFRKKYPAAIFVGVKKGEELAEYYASANVFVFPSRWDTFGMVMVEASATGTPVAAYPVRGPLQAVEHGVSGYLHEDLKTACLNALDLDRKEVELWTNDHFCWGHTASRFLSNLEKIDWRSKINWSNYK